MQMEKKYNIYTDASFDNITKLGTYAIIVMQENKIIKSISKKCRIQLNNSTDSEVFAVFQAINIILSCYYNQNKLQKFCINTDCIMAKEFFIQKNNKIRIFQENSDIVEIMKKEYNILLQKLSKNNCSFNIKWIPRSANKIAHKCSYNVFKTLVRVNNAKKEVLVIDSKTFIDILMCLNRIHYKVIVYLISASNNEMIIKKTQKDISRELDMSMYMLNKCFKDFIKLNVLGKIKNGEYTLLI